MHRSSSLLSSLAVDLHGLKLAFQTPDPLLKERFEEVYGHLPHVSETEADISIGWHLHQLPEAPPHPPGMPAITEDSLVSYYRAGNLVAVRLPRYALVMVDLDQKRLTGAITRSCLEAYGVFEDTLIITLAPLYRRQGWFPLHAFAGLSPAGQVALISGATGSGKTTTGLSLLEAGWKLLSNDSPLLKFQNGQLQVLAYPGRLSAFDDSLARFKRLHRFIPAKGEAEMAVDNLLAPSGSQKRVFKAEEAFTEPWASSGIAGGIFFPEVVPYLAKSELVPLSPKETLLRLMSQAIEGWDKEMIAPNLQLLNGLVAQAPGYSLKLSPHVAQLPDLIAKGMETAAL